MRKIILLVSSLVMVCSSSAAFAYTVSLSDLRPKNVATYLSAYTQNPGDFFDIDTTWDFTVNSDYDNTGTILVDMVFSVDLSVLAGFDYSTQSPNPSNAYIDWSYAPSAASQLLYDGTESPLPTEEASLQYNFTKYHVPIIIGNQYTLTGTLGLTAGWDDGYAAYASGTSYLSDIILAEETDTSEINPTTVPIPSAALLMGTGLVGLVGLRRRIRN